MTSKTPISESKLRLDGWFFITEVERYGSGNSMRVKLTEDAQNQLKELFREIVGADDVPEIAKDTANHWGLTENGIDRILTNGKKLGKNELRAELRKKIESL